MRIDVQIDNTALFARLRNGQRRLGYAAVIAINNTAKRIQGGVRERVEGEFTVRKPDFIRRQAAVIKPFASVKDARPFAEISVGQKPRLLLSQLERGGERQPFTPGAKHVAIPIKGSPARPTFSEPVPDALTFRKLRFRRTRAIGTTPSGKARRTKAKTSGIRYGEQGTYLIPGVGVFQRQTASRDRRLLYAFADSVRLKPRLGFMEIAQKHGQEWFREEMEREAIKAIAKSRGAGL